MRRSLAKFSESEASNHTPFLADFTTTTAELKFSVHTGDADAKVTIHAAVRYLLKNAAGGDRGDIVVEIIEIVRQAAEGLLDQSDPFGNETPGG